MDKSFYFVQPLNNDANRAIYALENYLLDNDYPNSETVDFDCAIIVFPSDKQLEYHRKIQKEDFDETIHINKAYYEMVKEMLENRGVKTISTTEEYLRLKGESKTWNMTLRKEYLPPWNLVFFTKNQEPMIVPPADLRNVLITKYFNTGQRTSR